jgi:hypothetical protein
LSQSEDEKRGSGKPSALLQNLATIASRAAGAHRKYQDARYGNSTGAASAGKQLAFWTCPCGWTGPAKDLKVTADGLSCPSCESARGLSPA